MITLRKKIINTCLCVALCIGVSVHAQGRFGELESRLQELQSRGIEIPADAIEASVEADALRNWLKTSEEPSEKAKITELCSLRIESALISLDARSVDDQTRQLEAQRDSVHTAIITIYRDMNQLERNYSSTLKTHLDEVRLKAKERQDDAQKKFEALQSDLIQVSTTARGIILSMSDILFEVGSAKLGPTLQTNLAKISGILTVYKEAHVLVEGHTDNVGGSKYNQELSEKRAGGVRDFLVEQGITADRLSAQGYGFTRPVADNSTADGRQKNRRVDLVISEHKSE